MIKKGVYAASLSILNKEKTLNIDLTINHAVDAIKNPSWSYIDPRANPLEFEALGLSIA